MVPRAVLMKSGLVSINTARQNISKTAVLVNTARQVNAAHSKTTMNAARTMSYLSKTAHSTVNRPIHKNTTFKHSNINQRGNTIRGKKFNIARPKAVVNAVKENNFNAVKASACWGNPQMDYRLKDVVDSGCSRHFDRTPTLSFMRPFGCPVTILNTIDHLGKFDGKADEGTQSNGFAGTKASDNAGQARKETEPICSALEDYSIFSLSRDDEDDGAEADMNNLDTTIQVSPIPTTRIHKDHTLEQVIRYLQSATQTRKMSKNLKEHGFVSTIQ
ncbi:hypothetical protein Tco_1095826 [Tanacetum coccineum]